MEFKVYPYREGRGYGNVIWAERNEGSAYYRVSKYAMRNGRFPPNHPVGGKATYSTSEMSDAPTITAFRERGYWASCFPEGDGITWKPLNGQSDAQCLADIRECFGWDAKWADLAIIEKDANAEVSLKFD